MEDSWPPWRGPGGLHRFSMSIHKFTMSIHRFSRSIHRFSRSIHRFSKSIYRVVEVHIRVFEVHIQVFEVHVQAFDIHIRIFDDRLRVFEVQKWVYDLENDSQRSKISFDHLNLDVWRSRKPISTSKVVEISQKTSINITDTTIYTTISTCLRHPPPPGLAHGIRHGSSCWLAGWHAGMLAGWKLTVLFAGGEPKIHRFGI